MATSTPVDQEAEISRNYLTVRITNTKVLEF